MKVISDKQLRKMLAHARIYQTKLGYWCWACTLKSNGAELESKAAWEHAHIASLDMQLAVLEYVRKELNATQNFDKAVQILGGE